jgi:hypothetical protein
MHRLDPVLLIAKKVRLKSTSRISRCPEFHAEEIFGSDELCKNFILLGMQSDFHKRSLLIGKTLFIASYPIVT